MYDFFKTFIACSLSMGFISLVFILFNPILRKKYRAKCLYTAGLFIVIGLLIPLRPQTGFTVFNMTSPVTSNSVNTAPAEDTEYSTSVQTTGKDNIPEAVPADTNQTEPAVYDSTPKIPVSSKASFAVIYFSIENILLLLWVSGILVSILYRVVNNYHFTNLINRWSKPVTDGRKLEIIDQLCGEMSIKKKPIVKICPLQLISTPMLKGIFKPVILFPEIELKDDEFYLILKHELVHYKRKDIYFKLIIQLATCFHWFNPAVYLFSKSMSLLCEQACDEVVLKNTGYEQRKAYSQALITISAYTRRKGLVTALSTNFYGGMGDMKSRISNAFDASNKKRGFSVLLCAALVIAFSGTVFSFDSSASIKEVAGEESQVSMTSSEDSSSDESVPAQDIDISEPVSDSDIDYNSESENETNEPPVIPDTDGRYSWAWYCPATNYDTTLFQYDNAYQYYESCGIDRDPETGAWYFQGKPIVILNDCGGWDLPGDVMDIEDNYGIYEGYSTGYTYSQFTKYNIDNGVSIRIMRDESGSIISIKVLNASETLALFNKYPEIWVAKAINKYFTQTLNDRIASGF